MKVACGKKEVFYVSCILCINIYDIYLREWLCLAMQLKRENQICV